MDDKGGMRTLRVPGMSDSPPSMTASSKAPLAIMVAPTCPVSANIYLCV
jgi:hypothetical protein